MKRTYAIILILTALLIPAVICCFQMEQHGSKSVTVTINDDMGFELKGWENKADGKTYYFLPSFSRDYSCDNLNHCLSDSLMGGGNPNEVYLTSKNVYTMIILTQYKNNKHLHARKENYEESSIILVSPEGDVVNRTVGRISGHGNSTWDCCEKKPYSIKMQNPTSFLGMPAASKWILLANAFDETNLRVKLTTDMMQRAGVEWYAQNEFVDLYLNGEYEGLYLLSENISSRYEDAGFMGDVNYVANFEYPLKGRYDVSKHPFRLNAGQLLEIDYPKSIDGNQFSKIKQESQLLEDIILSDSSLSCIDLESWAHKYLVDEITENLDADMCSSFFYSKGEGDNKIFKGGPLWDYDRIWGSDIGNSNPRSFSARRLWRTTALYTPWYASLYRKDDFRLVVNKLFVNYYKPSLQYFIERGIDSIEQTICYSANCNSLRWRMMFDTLQIEYGAKINTPQDLRTYLTERIEFLTEDILDSVPYHLIQVEDPTNGFYICNSIKDGDYFASLPTKDFDGVEWENALTKELFVDSIQITSDIRLNVVKKGNSAHTNNNHRIVVFIKQHVMLLSGIAILLLLACLMLTLVYVDLKRNKQNAR